MCKFPHRYLLTIPVGCLECPSSLFLLHHCPPVVCCAKLEAAKLPTSCPSLHFPRSLRWQGSRKSLDFPILVNPNLGFLLCFCALRRLTTTGEENAMLARPLSRGGHISEIIHFAQWQFTLHASDFAVLGSLATVAEIRIVNSHICFRRQGSRRWCWVPWAPIWSIPSFFL